jgi:DNA (cytosine-5)-methyltransferase 1
MWPKSVRLRAFHNDARPAVPGFYDFFCDSAIAGAGLEQEWQCLFANDVDPRKGWATPPP